MIVKEILIIDHANGEAGRYKFSSGANLITSIGNSQGKSSLIKTLYYGLGLDVKRFPHNWNPKKMTIKLSVHNERTGEDLYIIRQGDVYFVSGIREPLNASEYTRWLSKILEVDLRLTHRSTKITSPISYPSALITPFYVDQDESWAGRLYSSSNETGMYADTPERILDYILNISNDENMRTKEKLSQLKESLSSTVSKRSNINEVYISYINDEADTPMIDTSSITDSWKSNKQNIETFTKLMDELNKKYIEHKTLRIKLQRDLDQKKKSVEEYKSILKMYDTDYKAIKSICKNCKSELTREQVQTRMDISGNIYELAHLVASYEQDIKALEKKIYESTLNEESTSQEYAKLSKELDSNPGFKSIAEYIDTFSKKKAQDEFASVIQNLDLQIGKLTADVKGLTKELKASMEQTKGLASKIETTYSRYVNDLSKTMEGSNISDVKFKRFNVPQSSGVNDNQAYLGAYLTYMRLIAEYGRYKLPFCIDSFIKNETDDLKLKAMFTATEKYLLGIKGQSIFSAIKSNVERYVSNDNYLQVKIGNRLLTSTMYDDALQEVKKIVIIK
jgi:outer membrane murein-binding lipoprotein Lpp